MVERRPEGLGVYHLTSFRLADILNNMRVPRLSFADEREVGYRAIDCQDFLNVTAVARRFPDI